jgi:hypothetical protein
MNGRLVIHVLAGAALTLGTVPGLAQDKEAAPATPPMGAPPEMKMVTGMEGVYDVEFKYKMDPGATEWTTAPATVTITNILDGAAQRMEWKGDMLGMPFHGIGFLCYDRQTKRWQNTWIDNMAARLSYYEGTMVNGTMVLEGIDMMEGQKVHSRNTTSNITDSGFEWKMEMSMDGESYATWATAVYTKR